MAWYGQNYRGGRFDDDQLRCALAAMPETFGADYRPTVVLPRKNAIRRRGPPLDLAGLGLDDDGLERVPAGSDDDWYWMLATLSTASRGCDFVVTNDAARDHLFSTAAPRPFRRWMRRHVLRFEFAFAGGDPGDAGDAGFGARSHRSGAARSRPTFVVAPPPAFSDEIQRLGGGKRRGAAWFLPVAGERSVWLCLEGPPPP